MIAKELRFLRPSRELREFYILRAIDANPNASQRKIGREAMVSSTMVNNYLGEMVSREWVDITGDTNRSYVYLITDAGRRRKSELLFRISMEVVQMYGQMKQDFADRLRVFARDGVRRVALFGASETGELAYAAAKEAGLEIAAIVDNDPDKQGRMIGTIKIEPPDVIESRSLDAVVITSHGHVDEIFSQIERLQNVGIRTLKF